MQQKPKVIIGFCIKDCEATVKDAIDSIIKQDYPHKFLELIVVDGNSKDNTVSIVKNVLLRTDIKAKMLFENKGLGLARQMVIDNAIGDYIVWVDGDMILPPDHVRKQVEFMEKNPKVGIALGKFEIYPNNSLIATLDSIDWLVMEVMFGRKDFALPMLHAAGGSIYRVSAIKQIGGFDCYIIGALEDWDVQYRIKKKGWLISTTNAIFYSKRKEKLSALWHQNLWYGYGGHYISHKYKDAFAALAILELVRRPIIAYKLTFRKISFLLPLLYLFKKIAWFFGFIRAHLNGYGHTAATA